MSQVIQLGLYISFRKCNFIQQKQTGRFYFYQYCL